MPGPERTEPVPQLSRSRSSAVGVLSRVRLTLRLLRSIMERVPLTLFHNGTYYLAPEGVRDGSRTISVACSSVLIWTISTFGSGSSKDLTHIIQILTSWKGGAK